MAIAPQKTFRNAQCTSKHMLDKNTIVPRSLSAKLSNSQHTVGLKKEINAKLTLLEE